MYKILVVEDEYEIVDLIKELLIENGYDVHVAFDGVEGLEKFHNNKYDLIMSDIMMDRMDGFKMVEKIRETSNVPVIMLTALSEEYDEVKGFELGVNDYITKPYSINVLLLRVKAALNKNAKVSTFTDDLLEMNFDSLTAKYDNVDCNLTLKEFQILQYLINNKGRVFSREQIIDSIWGFDFQGDTRNIDTHIKNIRKKVPNNKITTVKGLGYRYEN